MAKPRVIYWFRTDLRLHDSQALKAALDLEPEVLWPIFMWVPHYVRRVRPGPNRWQFLIDCQNDLSQSITKLNKKSKLFVLRGAPQTLLPEIFKAWKPTHLVFEKDTEPYARARDEAVAKAARDAGVEVITRTGRTLWDSDEVVEANSNRPTMTIQQLQAAGAKLGEVDRPVDAPRKLPDPGETPLDFKHEGGGDCDVAGPRADFAIDTLEGLGLPPATTPHRGGESVALARLDKLTKQNREYMATFRKPQTSPARFEPQSTTLLSPFLHFGALSVRHFYWRVRDVVDGFGGGASTPPESMLGQLYFRDMYFGAQAALGESFAHTLTNPKCRFVPWHLPSRRDAADIKAGGDAKTVGGGGYHVDSREADLWYRRWKHGVTGFPWIDALMRQLRRDGWIHHLGRHSVACFLTRGGCYVDWERGAEVFADLLLDHEPACNVGNWQWLSCVAFFTQYYRCYSPVSFGQKWDKNGDLIREYVPQLRNLDAKYIYEPWKAPSQDLKKAGVSIEGDGLAEAEKGEYPEGTYPKPMFDFNERRIVCMSAMKQAFSVGLYGNDKKVLDGSWRDLFPSPDEAEVMGEYESDDGANADIGDEDEHHADSKTQVDGNAGKKRGRANSSAASHSKKQKA
ncbi:Cryptochrome-2 [Escovopsis weberi]|uniref:Cryptochrome-2 n=1 Tax=Escovopsis weberi TaxID=150374 RepID=A0A0M8N1Q0_ESCWE|nr:Cryptochrome-2 [Escovopsis weberi]